MIITKIAFVPAYEIHFLVQVDSHIFFHLVGQYFLGSIDTVIKQVYDFLRNRSLSCDECFFGTRTATDHLIQDILVHEGGDDQHFCRMIQHTLLKALCISIIFWYSHRKKLVILKRRIGKVKSFNIVDVLTE